MRRYTLNVTALRSRDGNRDPQHRLITVEARGPSEAKQTARDRLREIFPGREIRLKIKAVV